MTTVTGGATTSTARTPTSRDLARMASSHEAVTIAVDSSSRLRVSDLLAFGDKLIAEVDALHSRNVVVEGDHLVLNLSTSSPDGTPRLSGSFLNAATVHALHELVPARIVRSASATASVDRDAHRRQIGTTVILKFTSSDMPVVTAEELAGVSGVERPIVDPDQRRIILHMRRPSFDPAVVQAFVADVAVFLRTEITNPEFDVPDKDDLAQHYDEYAWREPEAEEVTGGAHSAD
jgi:hypothetical protein